MEKSKTRSILNICRRENCFVGAKYEETFSWTSRLEISSGALLRAEPLFSILTLNTQPILPTKGASLFLEMDGSRSCMKSAVKVKPFSRGKL